LKDASAYGRSRLLLKLDFCIERYETGYLTVFRVEITGEDEKEVTAVVPAAKIPAFALTTLVRGFGCRPAIAQEEVGIP